MPTKVDFLELNEFVSCNDNKRLNDFQIVLNKDFIIQLTHGRHQI